MMRLLIVFAVLVLTGCSGPDVTGNAQGGVMPWAFTNEAKVFKAAQSHCQKYGKDARITQIVPIAGGSASFDCVKA